VNSNELLAAVNALIESVNTQALQVAEVIGKVDALTLDVQACIDVCDQIAAVQGRGLQIPYLGLATPPVPKKNGQG